MSPQTESKASVGFKLGVKDYKLTYYTPEYEVKDTDILVAFRVTPQPGVSPKKIGAVAAESSTAYPLDLVEEGSVTNMFTSIMGNVERDKLNKYGHLLLGCTIQPKLGLSTKNYARAVYECLHGGLDFTNDDENVNSQPFMHCRDHFLFYAEAIYKAQTETGEIKGHYLNATASTCEEMMKRATCAKELGVPIIMHDYLIGGFTTNTTLAHYCRDNGLVLYIHHEMHTVIDRQKNHGMDFPILAKALRLFDRDHIHAGIVVGKLEREREITLGFVDLLHDDFNEKIEPAVSLPGVFPVALGGIHIWHMPALTEIFGDDFVLQFGGGTLGHPWGNASAAVANRVDL
ncbi:hypothetical protein PTKIN_Ptkin04bG0093900 [Pterospermum kingtungense]